MMLPEELRDLSPTERAAYQLASFWADHLKLLSLAWNVGVICPIVWASTCRRLSVQGLATLRGIPIDEPVILVANHRSFFDFFLVTQLFRYRGGGLRRRFFFPVRSTFFYDTPAGIAVNLLVAGMAMFPPIFRDISRLAQNRRSIERCIDELANARTAIGIHPEGTRNPGADPFALLPAKPGVGKVVLEARAARVVPVFVRGLGNDALAELRHNLTAPAEHPLQVLFGPEIDFSDLRRQGSRPKTQKLAADRCMASIAALAQIARATTSEASG